MFHPATKVTIIAERMLQSGIVKILEDDGAKGYTIVDGSGKGEHKSRDGDRASVVHDFSIIRIEVMFSDRKRAERVAEDVAAKYFRQYPGVVYLSPIEILRPERF
jgi:nitrogen regulatory protein PII